MDIDNTCIECGRWGVGRAGEKNWTMEENGRKIGTTVIEQQ